MRWLRNMAYLYCRYRQALRRERKPCRTLNGGCGTTPDPDPGRTLAGSVHMVPMILLTLIVATAVISSQITAHVTGRGQATDAAGHFAAVWREGYVQGAEDEAHAEAIGFEHSGYGRVGPNRANPYPGPEKLVQHA